MESRFPNINKVRRIKRGKRRSLVGAAYDCKRFYFLAEMSLSNGALRGIKSGIEKLVDVTGKISVYDEEQDDYIATYDFKM